MTTDTLPNPSPLLDALAGDLQAQIDSQTELLVGIHTGGVWVADQLAERLREPPPIGTLDISYYRDDLNRGGLRARQQPSTLPLSVDNKVIWLIDDVFYTGRTIRAAMNALFDFGRPAAIRLAVVIWREGHELPICPDLFAKRMTLPNDRQLRLIGPDPLAFTLNARES